MIRYSLAAAVAVLSLAGATAARADLIYNFATDVEGFQNVSWMATDPVGWAGLPGSIKQGHTAGGWQMQLTKEFSWGSGGGSAGQQLEMQALANTGVARFKFDAMVDGTSFPAGQATWFQLYIAGNSDGSAGWTQKDNIFTVSGWHNADDPTLISMHFDFAFSELGWHPGDTWFQWHTAANSAGAVPVNFYFDNVVAYVPEPSVLTLLGLGIAALLIRRRQ